ncbi:pyrroloquinoline quinone precursor peptide PqqA [Streptomyces sp. NPDC048581]|uniref:pyrroloquinoline quinone precursor peptide PqqA n=1 Tax=unclassified Streptomyces TaxID=2593676 RepID=UPI0037243DBF
MNEAMEQAEHPAARTTEAPIDATGAIDATAWQTPEYRAVDTALEVTAYSLTAR